MEHINSSFLLAIAENIIEGYDENTKPYALDTDCLNTLITHQILIPSYPFLKRTISNISNINAVVYNNTLLKAEKEMLSECVRINGAFNSAGVKYIIIKGPVLSIYTYGAYNKREYSDIDYIIFPDEAQKAHDILRTLGYLNLVAENGSLSVRDMKEAGEFYPSHYYPYKNAENNVGVELHTRLPEMSIEDFSDFYKRRAYINADEEHTVPTLDLNDTFICLLNTVAADDIGCACMTDEGDPGGFLRMKLRNYLDVYSFYKKHKRDIDTERIYTSARRYSCIFQFFLTLSFTADIFDTDIFNGLLEKLNITNEKNNRISLCNSVYDCLMDYYELRKNKDIISSLHRKMLYRNIQLFRLSPDNKWHDTPIKIGASLCESMPENEMLELINSSAPLKYKVFFLPSIQKNNAIFRFKIDGNIISEDYFVIDLSFMNPDFSSGIVEYRVDIFYNKGKYTAKFSDNRKLPDWNDLFTAVQAMGEDINISVDNPDGYIYITLKTPLKKFSIESLPVKVPFEVNIFRLGANTTELIQDMGDSTPKVLEIV